MAEALALNEEVNSVSDTEQEENEDVINPLNHEVVVRKVLSYTWGQDLLRCRQVNSLWNELCVSYMKRDCYHISFNNDNYWTTIKNHGIADMAKFTECFRNSANFPFVKLDVGTSIVKEPEDEDVVLDFFEVISSTVTELTIRDEYGRCLFSNGVPERIMFPKLQKLTLHLIEPTKDIINSEIIQSNFHFLRNIMKNAPIVDKLMLIDHNGLDGSAVTLFLQSINLAECLKITNLDLACQIEDEHLITLQNMGLKLKVLYLDFWGSVIQNESLTNFLESQAATLQILKLADYAMSSRFDVIFPRMKSLKTLMFKGSVLGRTCISFPDISYAKQFPVLKRLSFSNAMDEWDEFLKTGIKPVATVDELKLPRDCVDAISIKYAAHIFPNIKQLEIGASAHLVNTVCDFMPNLEVLILDTKFVDFVDDIITGFDIIECAAIKDFSKHMFKKIERNHLKMVSRKPISSLLRLKTLRLKCGRQSDPVELTDMSCRLVLLKMKSLKFLDFSGRYPPPDMVSEEVLLQMKKKFMVFC